MLIKFGFSIFFIWVVWDSNANAILSPLAKKLVLADS